MSINSGQNKPNTSSNLNTPRPKLSPDSLAQLRSFSWRGIEFPVINVTVNMGQDLAIHKYPDLDAARVENTGRDPMIIACTAVFNNSIFPGQNEHWQPGRLYPYVYQDVFNACMDRTTGILQHPLIGNITCKVMHCNSKMDANRRGGEDLDIQWIETIDNDDILTNISSDSAISAGNVAAYNLDITYGPDAALFPQLPEFPRSFSSIIGDIRGIIDTTTLVAKNGIGQIQSLEFQVNTLIESVNRINDIKLSKTKSNAYQLKALLPAIKGQVLVKSTKPTGIFVNTQPTTLADLSIQLANSVSDLMNLNPNKIALPIIKSNSQIRYYLNTTAQINPAR